jgi:RNA polymerase sigma-70 factor (ECF subfamily)
VKNEVAVLSEQLYILFRKDVRGEDETTQRELFSAFRELVYKDIYFLLNDHALTEDVIQESFLKAITHGAKTKVDSNMKAWLKRVSRNAAYDLLRKGKNHRHHVDIDSVNEIESARHETAPGYCPEEAMLRTLRDEALFQSINALKHEYKTVLLLHYILDMSYTEIGEELGISVQVLTQRLARARKKLAGLFTEQWGDANEAFGG